jgi:glycosyltransferase involved in cell wall biosynthesis
VVLLADNLKPHEKVPGTGPLNRWVLGVADRVVTLSNSVAGEARALGFKGPVQVLHHPVYDHFGPFMDRAAACQALGLSTERSYFLFFGLVRAYKGLDLLLRALVSPEFSFWNQPEGRSWTLLIAGEFYEPIEPYRRLVEELGLQDRVILHPTFVPDHRVAAYFGVAEALVLPYRHATQSGVTQAALHFGVPMIVTRVGGLAEELEGKGAGELCNPEVGELAAALQRFCSHPNRLSYRDSVQKLASHYGWRPFAEAVLADEGMV